MSGQASRSQDEEATERNAGGRPTKYKPEFCKQASKAADAGFTDRDIAELLGVNEATINRWKLQHPEFCASIKVGKAAADDRVEQSLYRKATGYTFNSEKLFCYEGVVTRADVIEHVPPSDTAAIFWLKNRRKDAWRDKHEVEHSATGDLAEILAQRRRQVAKLDG